MTAAVRLVWLLTLCSWLLASCGGVARNPSEPNFPAQGQRQQGGATGQAGAGGAGPTLSPDQDPNLQGAVSPEDFSDRAQVALIGGNLVTGVNGYTKLVELKPDDPEAALGLAVTTLWRDLDAFAPFTAEQLPLTFYNTPLTLVPTLVPQPLAQDDGYLWRLLSLGIDSQPGLDPTKLLADFLAEAGVKSAAGRPQPAQVDPEILGRLKSGTGTPATDDAARQEEETRKKEEIKSREGEDAAGEESARGGQALTDGTRTGQQDAKGDGLESAGGDGSSRGKVEGTRTGRNGGNPPPGGTGGAVGGQPPANTGSSQNPAAILSQTQYVTFTDDRPGQVLLPKLRGYLAQRSALSFTWEGRSAKLNMLRQSIDGLLTILDRTADKVNDDFHHEIPILLGTKTAPEVHKVAFEQADFEMIRQQLRLMKWLLDYRSMYTTAGSWNFLVPPADHDTDGLLSPAEYYPAAPFGTLTQSSKDGLAQMQSKLGEILRDMGEAMQEYRDAEIYTSSNKNYLLPRGLDQTLDSRVLLPEFDRMLDVSLALPKDEAEVQLSYARGASKVSVKYAPLFDGSLGDVRELLPAFDPGSRAVMPSEGMPASLMPTVLPDGTPFEVWINRSLTVDGLLLKNGVPLANADIAAAGTTTKSAEVTGLFNLPNVALSHLTGLEVTISGQGVTDPVTLVVRATNVAWDISLPLQHSSVPEPGAGAVATTPGGMTGTAAEGAAAGEAERSGGLIGGLQGRAGKVGGADGSADESAGDGATDETNPDGTETESGLE